MRCADNCAAIFGQERIGCPVQRVTDMHAVIFVSKNIIALAHDKAMRSGQSPSPISEFSATRIAELIQPTDLDLYRLRSRAFVLLLVPWCDFKQQQHARYRQSDTENEKIGPADVLDDDTGRCARQCSWR